MTIHLSNPTTPTTEAETDPAIVTLPDGRRVVLVAFLQPLPDGLRHAVLTLSAPDDTTGGGTSADCRGTLWSSRAEAVAHHIQVGRVAITGVG